MELLIVLILFVYLLPTVIACSNKHKQTAAIVALNLLAGWTGVGWIGAFVWALVK